MSSVFVLYLVQGDIRAAVAVNQGRTDLQANKVSSCEQYQTKLVIHGDLTLGCCLWTVFKCVMQVVTNA